MVNGAYTEAILSFLIDGRKEWQGRSPGQGGRVVWDVLGSLYRLRVRHGSRLLYRLPSLRVTVSFMVYWLRFLSWFTGFLLGGYSLWGPLTGSFPSLRLPFLYLFSSSIVQVSRVRRRSVGDRSRLRVRVGAVISFGLRNSTLKM